MVLELPIVTTTITLEMKVKPLPNRPTLAQKMPLLKRVNELDREPPRSTPKLTTKTSCRSKEKVVPAYLEDNTPHQTHEQRRYKRPTTASVKIGGATRGKTKN